MCGIFAIVSKHGLPVDQGQIRPPLDTVSHRGPDASGIYLWRSIGLGHRRLRIIDLDRASDQPFQSSDGDLVISYNGEVYNYIELRQELVLLGHTFRTASDTEVVLNAYRQWGTECVNRFNGMWAFALLDKTKSKLFCSRDRFGIKPLYYLDSDSELVLASEPKQIIRHTGNATARLESVVDFLLTQTMDSDEYTFFEGMRRVPPGTNLIYQYDSHRLELYPYYSLPDHRNTLDLSPLEATEEFSRLFRSSITLRMRSDVTVGTCLSGGLDSSSVATEAARQQWMSTNGERRLTAITAISTDTRNSEERHARAVVEHAGLHWLRAEPTYDDFTRVLDELAFLHDEPYGSPSIVMQHFVMKTAKRNGVTVLLDGQGGDEVFLGYEIYYPAAILALIRENGLYSACRTVPRILSNNDNVSAARLARFVVGTALPRLRFRRSKMQQSYMSDFPAMPDHLREFSRRQSNLFALQCLECGATKLPTLLRHEDRNSMGQSIEARLPLLDYRIVEFALGLPASLKIRDGWTKWIIREGMSKHLPLDIAWRKDKKGFEAPEQEWLARHEQKMAEKVLSSPLIAAISDRARLKTRFHSLDLRSKWRLYSTALWEQAFSVRVPG